MSGNVNTRDFFETNGKYISYLLMKYMVKESKPIGAWRFKEMLLEDGIDCGTATIGRHLKTLDIKKYTEQLGNQGRILTPLGKAYLSKTEVDLERFQMQNKLSETVQINNYDELEDLMRTRMVLEIEACALAAQNATEEDFLLLKESLERHSECVENNEDPTNTALDFHETISKICHNNFMDALLRMLIYEEKKIESKFESLLTRERGKICIKEHEQIAEAIYNRDSIKASQLMRDHLNGLTCTIEEDAQKVKTQFQGVMMTE